MSPSTVSPLAGVKALVFDVFGTVVNWRSSVIEELVLRAHRKTSSDLPDYLIERLSGYTEQYWAVFAQQWRDSYGDFTKNFDPSRHDWKTVDQHHRDSLVEYLEEWGLKGAYTASEIDSLSLVWHRLQPWPDSSAGIHELGKMKTTSTLSNGNTALLRDLNDFGNLGFQNLLSAEDFQAYKPNPSVYLGAAEVLEYPPHEIAMVAAHLADLKAARECGLRTIYVERPGEEDWKQYSAEYLEARKWVDLWITKEEEGFVTLAEKLKELA